MTTNKYETFDAYFMSRYGGDLPMNHNQLHILRMRAAEAKKVSDYLHRCLERQDMLAHDYSSLKDSWEVARMQVK